MSEPRTVVSVAFDALGRSGEFSIDPSRVPVSPGSWVVVESSRGRRLGRVTAPPREATSGGGRIRQVVRRARAPELDRQTALQAQEPDAFRLGLVAIRGRRLPVKLVRVVLDAMAGRATFCVAAPDRIDLNPLGAELSEALDLKVSFRQLGTRDVAQVLGGVGRCGQELCCSTFLTEFPRTSIRMAKDQGLPLNDDRVAGVCGRTLCCLSYEQDFYKERRGFLPKLGKRAQTLDGSVAGKCIGADVMQMTFVLLTDKGKRERLHASQWEQNAGRELPDDSLPATPEAVSAETEATPPSNSLTAKGDVGASDGKNPRRRQRPPKRKPDS